MGPPQPQRQPANVAGLFIVLAVLAGLGLLVVGALVLFGWSFYSFQTVAPPPAATIAKTAATNGVAMDSYTVVSESFDVEIDREGKISFNGETKTLDEVESLLQQRMQSAPIDASSIDLRVEEGCPFEHVQAVREMYQRLGLGDPNLTTVPPRREVVVELDAEGKPTLDGQGVQDITGDFQQIFQNHGARATLTLRVHPQCPAEVVVQIKQLWSQTGLGEVKIAEEENFSAGTP
jgi:biopolymer transport protein ExbD